MMDLKTHTTLVTLAELTSITSMEKFTAHAVRVIMSLKRGLAFETVGQFFVIHTPAVKFSRII